MEAILIDLLKLSIIEPMSLGMGSIVRL